MAAMDRVVENERDIHEQDLSLTTIIFKAVLVGCATFHQTANINRY